MDDNQLLRGILDVVKPLLIGCSGGVAALFVSKTKPTLLALVSCVFVSGFAGWMTGEMCAAVGIANENFVRLAVGIGGFYGPYTLRSLSNVVGKKLGIDFSSPAEQVEPAPCCEVGCSPEEDIKGAVKQSE